MSVWPLAIQIRTPAATGIIGAQNGKYPRQCRRIDAGVDDDATILSDLDHHAAARSRAGFGCDCLGSSNHRPHEAVLLDVRAHGLGAEGAPPRHQQ